MTKRARVIVRLMASTIVLSSFCATPAMSQEANGASAAPAGADSGEIVVTATRQSQSISKVPISISAYDQAKLDSQNVRRVDDVARLTPGLVLTRSPGINGNATNISIRGITSSIGAATTGVYIDDTPIMSRTLGNTATNAYPLIFDLERVEVLRGPQGTLFGASSEGGAVRFITPKPNLDHASGYARAEISATDSGGMNYEAGVAGGAPIIDGKLGFRASAWYRHDGGWVDRVPQLTQGNVNRSKTDENINSQNSKAFKLAVGWQPIETLTITPSFYYQDINVHDSPVFYGKVRTNANSATTAIFGQLSDPSKQDYNTPLQIPGRVHDRFKLPSLLIELELGAVKLVSDTSYFDRTLTSQGDYTLLEAEVYGQRQPYTILPGEHMLSTFGNTQKSFSQEVRLQSNSGGKLNWVIGGFYERGRQRQTQTIFGDNLDQLIGIRSGGTASVLSTYRSALLPGNIFFGTNIYSVDEQISGFVQADYSITDKLKVTAGVRVSNTKFNTDVLRNGPLSGGTNITHGQQSQTPATPKFGISYQIDPSTMVYASAAKGFRPGGAQAQLSPVACAADFTALGITATPGAFNSDSLWSYEGGSKMRLFGNKLQIDASGFYVKWKNIQQPTFFRSCSGSFIANTGTVTSRGLDVATQLKVVDGLVLGLSIGYTKATFDDTVYSVAPAIIKTKGSRINVPPFQFVASGQYDFIVANRRIYTRFDFQHSAQGPGFNPTDFGYDPQVDRIAMVNNLTLRVGAKLGTLDLSVFADNVLNAHPVTYTRSSATSGLFSAIAPRPRVIGATAAYRY
jgi:iron complex outermembrane receptor protein